jgi:hypothetical protein
MEFRRLLVVLAATLASCSFGSYEARLYFENVTQGLGGPGEIIALPGDQLCIKYSFHGDGGEHDKWSILQMTLCLKGNCCLPCDPDGVTWYDQIMSVLVPPTEFGVLVAHQCDWGPMYDNGLDPTDSDCPFVCNEGLYFLIGVYGTSPKAQDWDVTLFSWTAGCESGLVEWTFDGRDTGTGLSTRIIDGDGETVDVADNWIHCVPEPGSIAAIGVGLLGLLALRRRK